MSYFQELSAPLHGKQGRSVAASAESTVRTKCPCRVPGTRSVHNKLLANNSSGWWQHLRVCCKAEKSLKMFILNPLWKECANVTGVYVNVSGYYLCKSTLLSITQEEGENNVEEEEKTL